VNQRARTKLRGGSTVPTAFTESDLTVRYTKVRVFESRFGSPVATYCIFGQIKIAPCLVRQFEEKRRSPLPEPPPTPSHPRRWMTKQ
jgi:hypothetical protein